MTDEGSRSTNQLTEDEIGQDGRPVEAVSAEKTSIGDLPDEILELIFLNNTLRDATEDPNDVDDRYRTTISTLLVCRRWYNVAVGYPDLWGRIVNYQRHQPPRVAHLLALSKSSILDVGEDSAFNHIRLRDARGKAILGHIFQRAQTLRTLSLEITFAPWDFICKKFLQHPAPMLEFLNLITSCPFPDCLFPGPLFADQAPRLRRVHLQRCLVDFSSSALTHLTELSVMDILSPMIGMMRGPDHPLKVAPTAVGWLRILQTIPSLRYLTLSNAISPPPPPTHDEGPTPNVDLPNLLFLTVGSKFQDGVEFLGHLSIPTSCGVRLRLSHRITRSGAELSHLLTFLRGRLSHWPEDTSDRYLQAKILSGDRIHFGNSRRVGHIWDMTEEAVIQEHASNTADPLTWLVLSFDDHHVTLRVFEDLLALYQPTYSTTTVLDLWLDDDYVFADPTTAATGTAPAIPSRDILSSFTSVKALNLLERSPNHLLPIFQTDTTRTDHIFFPSLRSLRLTRINLESGHSIAYSTIVAFLIWRTGVDAPLTEIQMIESRISKETEESLARIGNVRITFGSASSTAEDISDDDGF